MARLRPKFNELDVFAGFSALQTKCCKLLWNERLWEARALVGGSGVNKKVVIFNVAAEAEAIALIFDTRHANAALQTDGRARITKAAHGYTYDAIYAVAKGEPFA